MAGFEKIAESSDTLIGLLTAQCADLEELLSLARAETAAAEQRNFLTIVDIVSDRERIGRRLETYQGRIAELRRTLGPEAVTRTEAASRAVEVARLTMEQDQKTRLLLSGACDEITKELQTIDRTRARSAHYAQTETRGLRFDRSI